MQAAEAPKPPRRPSISMSVMAWGLIATGATIYLGVAVARPDLLIGMKPSTPQSNEGQRALSEAVTELKALQEAVVGVSKDLNDLKAESASNAAREAEIASRLVALETKPGKTPAKPVITAAKTAAPAPAPVAVHSVAPAPAAAPRPAVTAAAVPAPATATAANAPVKVLNAPLGEGQVVTGSVVSAPATAVDFGPAIVTPAATAKPIGIQIARGPSVDALRLSWNLLTDRHGAALQSLEPRYTTGSDASGETFDLMAGPVKSAAEAQKICQELIAQAVPCKVSNFGGDAL